MAEGPPEDMEEQGADEGRILSPEELDISESEHVEQLDEGRFVVSPDGPPNVGPDDRSNETQTEASSGTPDNPRDDDADDFTQQSETHQPEGNRQQPSGGERQPPQSANRQRQPAQNHSQPELTEEAVHDWLRQSFERRNSTYAFDVTATFEGQVSQRRMASNDVVTVFESLLLWYAQQVDSNTPVEEILGILLTESNVPVQYPPKSIHKLVKSSGLEPEDSIADLLEAIDDGAKL